MNELSDSSQTIEDKQEQQPAEPLIQGATDEVVGQIGEVPVVDRHVGGWPVRYFADEGYASWDDP